MIVAYSGGYVPAAWALHKGGASSRVIGVLMLDALYGEVDKYADWIGRHPNAFFISAYTSSSARGNEALQQHPVRARPRLRHQPAAAPAGHRGVPAHEPAPTTRAS